MDENKPFNIEDVAKQVQKKMDGWMDGTLERSISYCAILAYSLYLLNLLSDVLFNECLNTFLMKTSYDSHCVNDYISKMNWSTKLRLF